MAHVLQFRTNTNDILKHAEVLLNVLQHELARKLKVEQAPKTPENYEVIDESRQPFNDFLICETRKHAMHPARSNWRSQ